MSAILVLGMHRSGTSCLAGMLAAAGLASAGEAVRNWDNARGHHEMLDVVRLNEAVLAHSGGHWLSAPATIAWTEAHAAARDALLRAVVDGRAALLKDPRTLLTLPFWRASPIPFRTIGIVRHPLAVARSLASWRAMPLVEGIALWTAHNRALATDRARFGYAVVDFEQPKAAVVAAVAAVFDAEPRTLAEAYEEQLVHHDDGDPPELPGLADAIALYAQLVAIDPGAALPVNDIARSAFPRAELARFTARLDDDLPAAVHHARAALAAVRDAAAVLVPVVTALIRRRAYREARALIDGAQLDDGLADLLHGKVLLAMGDAPAAVDALEAACDVARPFYQARHLLPQALRAANRTAEARGAMQRVIAEALYPHGPLATLAEWSWLDGERDLALAEIARAIAAAPLHRRGRLRTRHAEWLIVAGDRNAAARELALAIEEDPAYARSREVLARL